MNLKTAIIVFANSAKKELEHKPIVGGEKLFLELTKKTISVVKSTELPFFVFSEKNQKGNSFGERFTEAINTTFDLGFENVMIIGNDTPHLKKHHLLESAKHLQNGKLVLGPSMDGGFYLLGLHKSQFNLNKFLKLPWQSRQLIKSISQYIEEADITLSKLPILYDIDTIEDLKAVTRFSFILSRTVAKIIKNILSSSIKFSTDLFMTSYKSHELSFYNKGSPSI